jgi:phosphoglycolate phosphatase
MNESERPRTVLFDWDNTLVDTWGVIHQAINATLAELGRPTWSFAETQARVRRSAREAFPAWFGADAERAAEIFYARFERDHLDGLQPRPGAAAMLAALAGAGYDLAVISNKRGDLLRREVAHLGWQPHFRRLVGAGDAARDKPDPAAVALALTDAPAGPDAPERVWLVGDTDIDLVCAANAGCVPVLLRESPPGPGEFDAAPPAHHAPGCVEIAEMLRCRC